MIYRLSMTIEDEVEAEELYKAWEIFQLRFVMRYYGPTWEHIAEVGAAPGPEEYSEE